MKRLIPGIGLFIFVAFATVSAQTKIEVCYINRNAPPRATYRWPPDALVNVYLVRKMFTPEQRAALLAAMEDWTNEAARIGAGVKFEYAGETDEILSCHNCLTVTRREVNKHDRKYYALFNPLKEDEAALLEFALIDFDFATKDPEALRGFMAHELGHGLGLWDCSHCAERTTIMNSFPGINKNNGLIEPARCDLEAVRAIYWRTRQNERLSNDTGR